MKDPTGHIVHYDPGEPPYWEDDTGGQHLMMEDTMREILAELRALRLALGSQSRSSVELKTSARGVDITTKAYDGSDISEAGVAAISEYGALVLEVKNRIENGWETGVAAIVNEKSETERKDATYKRIYGEEPNSVYDLK